MNIFQKINIAIVRKRGHAFLKGWRKRGLSENHGKIVIKRHAEEFELYVDLYWSIYDRKANEQIDSIYQRASWKNLKIEIEKIEESLPFK